MTRVTAALDGFAFAAYEVEGPVNVGDELRCPHAWALAGVVAGRVVRIGADYTGPCRVAVVVKRAA